MLDLVDLNPHEQAVYELLIDGAAMTQAELIAAVTAGVEVSSVLASLEAKGLVSRNPGSPVRFAAVEPEIALEVLFLERERQLKQARGYVKQLSARFQRSDTAQDPAELVEIISGRRAIRQRSEQLQRGAREQFRGVDKPPYTVDSVNTSAEEPVEAEMLRRGIRYRVIYDAVGLETFHQMRSDLEESMSLGEEARVLTNAPTKLIIIDDRVAMIPLEPASASLVSMIVVHPSGLLDALVSLFEDLWRRSLPLTLPDLAPQTGGPSSDHPTQEELRLLNLLATGITDDAIAKHLNVSHRTMQRRLRALLDRLDADTRFQAGVQANRRGWLP